MLLGVFVMKKLLGFFLLCLCVSSFFITEVSADKRSRSESPKVKGAAKKRARRALPEGEVDPFFKRWNCPGCGASNEKENVICRRCYVERPDDWLIMQEGPVWICSECLRAGPSKRPECKECSGWGFVNFCIDTRRTVIWECPVCMNRNKGPLCDHCPEMKPEVLELLARCKSE
jgi:hypothetical protein